MESEKEFQDMEDKRKQLFLNQKQLLDTFLDMGEALTTRSGFARPENSPVDSPAACGGARDATGSPRCACETLDHIGCGCNQQSTVRQVARGSDSEDGDWG